MTCGGKFSESSQKDICEQCPPLISTLNTKKTPSRSDVPQDIAHILYDMSEYVMERSRCYLMNSHDLRARNPPSFGFEREFPKSHTVNFSVTFRACSVPYSVLQ